MSLKTAITLVAALPATAFAATPAPVPEVLTGGPWNLHYAEDSCRLAREFGQGDGKVQIMMEFFRPRGGYQLLLAGKRFAAGNHRAKVSFSYGPNLGTPVEITYDSGTIDESVPTLLGPGPRLDNGGRSRIANDLPAEHPVTVRQEAAIRTLSIDFRKRITILEIGSMAEPMASVRTCLDNLLTSWGLDPAVERTVAKWPRPANSDMWLDGSGYPLAELKSGQEAVLHFRLIVGTDGRPENCATLEATQPQSFREAACSVLMKRARLLPAQSDDGNPVRSYYISTLRWIVP